MVHSDQLPCALRPRESDTGSVGRLIASDSVPASLVSTACRSTSVGIGNSPPAGRVGAVPDGIAPGKGFL